MALAACRGLLFLLLIITNLISVIYIVMQLEDKIESQLDCVKLSERLEHTILNERLAVQKLDQMSQKLMISNCVDNRDNDDQTNLQMNDPRIEEKPMETPAATLSLTDVSYYRRTVATRANLDPEEQELEAKKRRALLAQLSYASDIFTTTSKRGIKSFNINNSGACHRKSIDLLIWIHSAPGHVERRHAVRDLWRSLKTELNVKLIFGIGKVEDRLVQENLDSEYESYQDLVQDNSFIDSYMNLTFKTQSMLRWVDSFCPDAKVVMKTDDDTVILFNRFIPWYKRNLDDGTFRNKNIIGLEWQNEPPITNPLSKWYTPPEIWPEPHFANSVCSGWLYFITQPAIHSLREAMESTPFLWLEDMYLTGIVAQAAGIPHQNIEERYSRYRLARSYDFLQKNKDIFFMAHTEDLADYVSLCKHDFDN